MGNIGRNLIGTGWKDQPVPKGLPACVSVAASVVPVGLSNRYQWMSKATSEKPGVLSDVIGFGLGELVGKLMPKTIFNRFPWHIF